MEPLVEVVTLTGAGNWLKAVADATVLDFMVQVPSSNAGATISLRINGGTSKAIPRNTAFRMNGVDLSRFEFAGTSGDVVIVTGHGRQL